MKIRILTLTITAGILLTCIYPHKLTAAAEETESIESDTPAWQETEWLETEENISETEIEENIGEPEIQQEEIVVAEDPPAEPIQPVYIEPDNPSEDTGFEKYQLTYDELLQIASLCRQEQGSVEGAAAEASLMANRYELHGWNYSSLYSYVRNCRWFAHAASYMDARYASDDIIWAVKTVLVDGKRTMPLYIDEHDCLSDLTYNSTGNIYSRNRYFKNQTYVRNCHSGSWTFYSFPTDGSDPFGYTSAALRDALNGGFYYDLWSGEKIYDCDYGYTIAPQDRTIDDGSYKLRTETGSYLANDLTVTGDNTTDNVTWQLRMQNGYYILNNNEQNITLKDGSQLRDTEVVFKEPGDWFAESWLIWKQDDGSYIIQSAGNGFYLSWNGTSPITSENTQRWYLEKEIPETTTTAVITQQLRSNKATFLANAVHAATISESTTMISPENKTSSTTTTTTTTTATTQETKKQVIRDVSTSASNGTQTPNENKQITQNWVLPVLCVIVIIALAVIIALYWHKSTKK